MSESCNRGLKSDFLSDLKSHKCFLCERCLVCHHCLLARGYLRNRKLDIPEVNAQLDDILQSTADDDDDPPRYIFVGPNNEIVESRPNGVHLLAATNKRMYSKNHTYFEQFPVDMVDPTTPTQDNDTTELFQPVSIVSDKDVEPEPQEPVSYECKECDKTFSTAQDFNMHKIYHSVEEIHECKICNKTFNYSYELIKHSLYHDDKLFFCEHCDKQFATEEKLRLHMRFHTGARPFVCTVCEKAFKENGTLKNHLLTHTDERPFQCDKCGRSFRFKLKLERHNWIHEGIKPYACLVCEKTFRHKCNLRSHVQRHHNMTLEKSIQLQDVDDV